MKILEALTYLETFDRVVEVSHFTTEEKFKVGAEILRQLPDSEYVASPATLNAIKRSIKDRMSAMEQEINGRAKATPKETSTNDVRQGKQLLRKAKSDS